MKKYLILFGMTVTREAVKAALNASPLVKTWRYDLPHSFYFVSESSAQQLFDDLNPRIPGKKRFLIVEIANSNKQGLLPRDTWDFLNKKYE
jgi:hypothetical protein